MAPVGAFEVFWVALRLGLTSFGGPAAHLGYFRREYVQRRAWLDDATYAELVALAQFLPGPSSSQVGAAIGAIRAGVPGAAAAWLGFTLPAAVTMAAFAAFTADVDVTGAVWLRALQLVAVAVVLDAVLGLAAALTRTWTTRVLAGSVAAALLVLPVTGLLQVTLLALAAVVGALLHRTSAPRQARELPIGISRRVGAALLATLAGLVMLAALAPSGGLPALAAAMLRAGSLVFGGGHVLLPLLQPEVVPELMDGDTFLAGYGAVQAVPGPLFTFASYLGEVVAGPAGAFVAVVAIFTPGLLLFFGVLPFWQSVRSRPRVQAALVGVNAGVVGLLAAAWVDPIVTHAVISMLDAAFAAALFGLLRCKRATPLLAVVVALALSPLLALQGG